jgi:hypothetical protein
MNKIKFFARIWQIWLHLTEKIYEVSLHTKGSDLDQRTLKCVPNTVGSGTFVLQDTVPQTVKS